MKKLLVLALVLSMASIASAALTLDITATQLSPSGEAVISISGDGSEPVGTFYLGIVDDGGAGSLNIDNATTLYTGNASGIVWDENAVAGMIGLVEPCLEIQFNGTPPVGQENPPLDGLLMDGIVFHCDGLGDVTIQLFNGNGDLLSSVVIAQPEPITIGLLGLGALFLRRRK